jgi:hypothetical protein
VGAEVDVDHACLGIRAHTVRADLMCGEGEGTRSYICKSH